MLYVLLHLLVLLINFRPWRVEACKTAADCAYSGECNSEVCTCNINWSGPNCTTLRLLPSSFPNAAGVYRRKSSSWGGSVIWDPEQKLWVIFFADFEGHCGLDTWKTNSRICMSTAGNDDFPTGPFGFNNGSNCSVVLPVWAHNPSVYGPIKNNGDPVYLMFHIGDEHKSNIYGPHVQVAKMEPRRNSNQLHVSTRILRALPTTLCITEKGDTELASFNKN